MSWDLLEIMLVFGLAIFFNTKKGEKFIWDICDAIDDYLDERMKKEMQSKGIYLDAEYEKLSEGTVRK